MKAFLFPLLFICSSVSFSQSKQFLYYFDKDLNSTPKAKAFFNAVGTYTTSLLEIKVYNTSNNHLTWSQHFLDSSLQVSEGLYQSYYPDGTLESEGNYSKNSEDGLWQKWDSSGRNIDSSFYEKDILARYVHRGYYKNGFPDSIIINDRKTNELAKTFYNDSGIITSQVVFTGEKGLEKFYAKGVLNHTDSVYSREEIEASFPNGADAWTKYIASGLQTDADEIYKDNVFGSCIVKFIVSKEGKVVDVEAINMKGTALAKVAVRIIKNSPKWNPASQYGHKVNAYRLQPVTMMASN